MRPDRLSTSTPISTTATTGTTMLDQRTHNEALEHERLLPRQSEELVLSSVRDGRSERLALLYRVGDEDSGHGRSFIGGFVWPPSLNEERIACLDRDCRPALDPEHQCAIQHVADLLPGVCVPAWSEPARDLDQGLHYLTTGGREVSLLSAARRV
jgi:hypothetical protein